MPNDNMDISRGKCLLCGLTWGLITAALVIGLVFILTFPRVAKSQSPEEGRAWIHANAKDCCPHQFCFQVEAQRGMTLWVVWGYRSVVRIGRERRWPFEQTWGCAYPHDPKTVRCLFVPPQEQS